MRPGIRIDPPPSEPVAHGTMPDATAAAEPPDDPPGVRVGSHGLRVTPFAALAVQGKIISSGTFVIPIGIAPAARSLRTTSPSAVSGGRYERDPRVTDWPATGMSSLIATGTPASGPSASTDDICSAVASASSAITTRNAFSLGPIASIRARNNSTSSRGATSRRRTMSASAPGPANASSCSAVAVIRAAPSRARESHRDSGR